MERGAAKRAERAQARADFDAGAKQINQHFADGILTEVQKAAEVAILNEGRQGCSKPSAAGGWAQLVGGVQQSTGTRA